MMRHFVAVELDDRLSHLDLRHRFPPSDVTNKARIRAAVG